MSAHVFIDGNQMILIKPVLYVKIYLMDSKENIIVDNAVKLYALIVARINHLSQDIEINKSEHVIIAINLFQKDKYLYRI